MRQQLLRKGLHTTLAIGFLLIAPVIGIAGTLGLCAAVFVVFISFRLLSRRLKNSLFRATYGELFFIGGVALSALLFLPEQAGAFQAGMLVLGFADPLAALVGMYVGTHKYRIWGEQKSIEGSATCEFVSIAIFLAIGLPLLPAIIGGVLMGMVEAGAPRGSDNFVLPVAAGIVVLFFV